jgi:hypothetical protein
MINPEAVQEWRANIVTIEMVALLEKEKQRLMEAMGNGNFLNLENMQESFSATAKCVGVIEGIDTACKLLQED